MDWSSLEGIGSPSTVVVGFQVSIKVLRDFNVKAVVCTTEDIDKIH
jgi:hypothetical protein